MKVDYMVVGFGLAGLLFCEKLRKAGKRFVVIDDESQQSSVVAGGLYNPVVLKRFTGVWRSQEQLDLGLPIYRALEEEMGVKIDYKLPVYRLFASVEEQNNWFLASDKPNLSNFLAPEVRYLNHKCIKASYGFGEVLHTGRIAIKTMLEAYRTQILGENYRKASFEYAQLQLENHGARYNAIETKNIVFAEGFGLKNNPYFSDLPLKGTKGELLVIHAPDLKMDFVLKSSAFLIPIGADTYIVGATYEWEDKTHTTTEAAKQELLDKMAGFIDCDFEIVDQIAGIRPTVIDRRPLVGTHQQYPQLHVLNGLGTRGVMIAPYVAEQLFHHIENGNPLDTEIDIQRFQSV